MMARYAPDALAYRGPLTRRPAEPEDMLDEWAACGIERAEDIKDALRRPLLLRLRGRRSADVDGLQHRRSTRSAPSCR